MHFIIGKNNIPISEIRLISMKLFHNTVSYAMLIIIWGEFCSIHCSVQAATTWGRVEQLREGPRSKEGPRSIFKNYL